MKNTLILLACSIFLFSCEKDDDDTPAEPTKTELMTKASWKYDNAGVDADRNGTIDFPAGTMLQACLTDNILTLSANGTGNVDEGPTKCDAAQPQTSALTWNFTSNETMINLSGGGIVGISGQAKILALSSTALSLSKDTTIAPLGNVALIVNLKH
jgi:hypothetical protein